MHKNIFAILAEASVAAKAFVALISHTTRTRIDVENITFEINSYCLMVKMAIIVKCKPKEEKKTYMHIH